MNKNYINFLIIFLMISGTFLYGQTQKGGTIVGSTPGHLSGSSVSMPDVNTLAIGIPQNSNADAGYVQIHTWNGNTWVQKGNDIIGENANDRSGWSISMPDANTIGIGAFLNDANTSNEGHVRIYTWDGNAWIQKGIDIDGEAAGDQSGYSISMPDANTVAIGGFGNDDNGISAGHVRIYTWNGSAWVQKGIDIDGEAAGDESGRAVNMPDANTIAIGAFLNDGVNGVDSGHVRIYTWNGSTWIQKGMDIDGEFPNDRFGWSVSMPDANTIAASARFNNGNGTASGHVRIYSWNGSAWIQKGVDINGEAPEDQSGTSISMPTPNVIAIGANRNNNVGFDAGHVRVYNWESTAWVQRGVDINGTAANDLFGGSVSMPDEDTVASGAPWHNDFRGHARVFSFSPLSIDENSFSNTLSIYPNPASSLLTIQSKETIVSVTIYSILGKKVITLKSTNVVDVSNLNSGIYMMRIIGENNEVSNLKFVKE